MQCGTLNWILEQKKDIVGKLVKSKNSLAFHCQCRFLSRDKCITNTCDANIREAGRGYTATPSTSIATFL